MDYTVMVGNVEKGENAHSSITKFTNLPVFTLWLVSFLLKVIKYTFIYSTPKINKALYLCPESIPFYLLIAIIHTIFPSFYILSSGLFPSLYKHAVVLTTSETLI